MKYNDSSYSYSSDGNQLLSEKDSFGNTTSYTYNNELSETASTTDGRGNTTNYIYDNMGQLTGVSQTATNPYYTNSKISLQNVYEYSEGKISSVISGGAVQYHFEYDKWGNVSQIKVGNTALVTYHYTNDTVRNIQKLEYANGLYTEYAYDENKNLSKVYYGNPTDRQLVAEYSYDADQNLSSIKNYDNNTLTKYKNDVIEVCDLSTGNIKYAYGTSEIENGTAFYEKSGGHKLISEYTTDKNDNSIATFKSVGMSTAQETVLYKHKTENDSFNRVIKKSVTVGSNTTETLTQTYSYENPASGYTTDRVSAITNATSDKMKETYSYSYDANGNISKILKNGTLVNRYEYDEANQLIREDNAELDKTYIYRYDNRGNILEKRTYAFTTNNTLGAPLNTVTYGYADSNWQDKLTSYNGKSITYDANGNPLTFDGYTYTWEGGRQLTGISGNGLKADYTYDDKGIRTSKTVNGIKTDYNLADDRIISETTGNATIHYRYNVSGELVGLYYNGDEYFYVKNLQNDIIGIVNASGTLCVTYTYDAWGNATIGGSLASTLGVDNPFRYRGYYYDKETQYYYLQSRYYNPKFGRFINADNQFNDDDSIVGTNLFTYCYNNPINIVDYNGKEGITLAIFGIYLLVSSVALLLTAAVVISPEFQRGWNNMCASIGNQFLRKLKVIGGTIKLVAQLMASKAKAVAKAIGISFSKVKTKPNYRSSTENHHIIARKATPAKRGREILASVGIDIDSSCNIISLKTGLHRRLHTHLYYGWTNSVVISAFNAAKGNKDKANSNVTKALKAIWFVLRQMDLKAPF